MRKLLYSALLSLILIGGRSASAQDFVMNEKFVDNTFVQTGGGLSTLYSMKYYHTGVSKSFGPMVDFNIGKWISPTFGIRAGLQAGRMNGLGIVGYTTTYLHADAMLNANNVLAGYAPDRFWNISPYLHFGLLTSQLPARYHNNGHEFVAGFGLMNTFKITDRLSVYADFRPMFFKQDLPLDASNPSSVMPVLAGFMYNFGRTGWGGKSLVNGSFREKDGDKYTGLVAGRFTDNTFVMVGAGIQGVYKYQTAPTFAYDISLGKWINPIFGVRVGFGGGKMTYQRRNRNLLSTHGDLLLNLNNLIGGYSNDRFWNISPYVSAEWMYASGGFNEIVGGAGLLNTFRLVGDLSAFIDFRSSASQTRLFGNPGGVRYLYSATAGVYYAFGGQYWDRRELSVSVPSSNERNKSLTAKSAAGGVVTNDGISHNAFIQIGGGVNALYKRKYAENGFSNGVGLTLDLAVGKWVTPIFGIRGGIAAGYLAPKAASKYMSTYAHVDALLDANAIFAGYRPDRVWSIAPYAHFGLLSSTQNDQSVHEFAGGFGVLNSFRLSDTFGLFLDLRPSFFKQDIPLVSNPTSQLSATFGITSYFGRPAWGTVKSGVVRGAIDETDGDTTSGFVCNRFIDNTFVQIGGGISSLAKRGAVYPHGQLGIGKWVTTYLGTRFMFEGFNTAYKGNNYKYMSLHGDLLLNLNSLIGGYKPDRLWSVSPYVGAGFAHSVFNEPTAWAGLYNTFRISPVFGAYLDLQSSASQGRIFGDKGHPFISLSAFAGLYFSLGNEGGWSRQELRIVRPDRKSYLPEGEIVTNKRFIDNTFVTVGGGVNALSYAKYFNMPLSAKVTPVIDITAGKWISPVFGLRFGISTGDVAWSSGSRIPDTYLHSDAMLNLNNLFAGYRPGRIWNISPYMHAGLRFVKLDNGQAAHELTSGPGLLNTFSLTDRMSLFLDMRQSFFKQNLPVYESHPSGLFSATAGIAYNFGRTEWGFVKNGTVHGGIHEIDGDITDGYIFNKFFANTFMQFGAGVSGIFEGVGAPSLVFDANLGKWITPSLGVRIGGQGIKEKVYDKSKTYLLLHSDLLVNLNNLIGGYKPDRVWTVSPYVSAGVGHSTFNEITLGAGILNNFQFTNRVGAFVDFRTSGYNGRVFQNAGRYYSYAAFAGFTVNFGENRFSPAQLRLIVPSTGISLERGAAKGVPFLNNTFASVYGGVNILVSNRQGIGFNGRVAPAMELDFGKWFSPRFAARIGVSGANMSQWGVGTPINENILVTEVKTKNNIQAAAMESSFFYLHGDLLWNCLNSFSEYNPARKYSLIPYAHLGYMSMFGPRGVKSTQYENEILGGVGLINGFRLADRVSLNVDLRATLAHSDYLIQKKDGMSVLGTAMFGFVYDLGHQDFVLTGKSIYEPDGKQNKFFDNTFATLGVGLNAFSGKGLRPGTALDVNFGKWMSPSVALEIGYQGLQLNGSETLSYGRVGAMWNPWNTFSKEKKTHVYELRPYLHGGLLRSSALAENEFAFGAGLRNVFKLGGGVDANIDLRGTAFAGRYSHNFISRSSFLTAILGLTYNINTNTWREEIVKYREDDEEGNIARRWAISTNVLDYADMGTLNVEVQYGLGRHWSTDAQIKENSWNFSGRMNQRQTVAIGAKYWPWYLYSGMWFRGTAQFERYRQADKFLNFGTSNQYEQGDKYGAGLSLGYSLMIKPWFNIDFGVGIWGGYKSFVQYKDSEFNIPVQTGVNKISQGKFFFEPNEISVSAMFVF